MQDADFFLIKERKQKLEETRNWKNIKLKRKGTI